MVTNLETCCTLFIHGVFKVYCTVLPCSIRFLFRNYCRYVCILYAFSAPKCLVKQIIPKHRLHGCCLPSSFFCFCVFFFCFFMLFSALPLCYLLRVHFFVFISFYKPYFHYTGHTFGMTCTSIRRKDRKRQHNTHTKGHIISL